MADTEEESSAVHEVDGRLHVVNEIRDEAGKLVTKIASPLKVEVKWEDLAQLIAGALMLGAPVAFTEEVWNLGERLSPVRIWMIFSLSFLVNAFFVWMLFYRDKLDKYWVDFIKRVCAAYGIAFLVALVLLTMIDKGPFDDPVLALKRAVLIAFPASFAAISIDYIR